MFIHTKGLQSIDISQNQIAELNDQPFSGLTNLVTINLENNLLLSLPEGIFDGLASLENILLRGNHLTSIDAMTFRNLHSLNRIDISQNNLSHISEDAMGLETSDFTQLKHMHLSQNNLEDFPLWLLQLEVLADIDLSHNRLSFERLKLVLSRIPNTEFLSYNNGQGSRHNNNYFLPATEKTIKFRNNSFTNFDLSLLVDEELVNFLLLLNYFQLDFSGNNFTCECDIYSLYNYLRNFDTAEFRDYNQIGILPYNMNNIICQQPVDLQGVPLVEAPVTSLGCYEEIPGCPRDCQCWVRTVDEVVKVICRNKTLTELPESLPHNTTELDFSGNLLTSLPQDVPDYFSSVDILDFSENVLTHLDGSLFKILKNTWKLNLHGNYLTILPAEVSYGHFWSRNIKSFLFIVLTQQVLTLAVFNLFKETQKYIWTHYIITSHNFFLWNQCCRSLCDNTVKSYIRPTLTGNEIVDHSDVVGESPLGAAPTTSSFSTQHLASVDCTKTTARRDEKHLTFGIWCVLY